MSKSYGNTVGLFEEEKPLKKKIMGIPTDSTPVEAPKSTEGSTILQFYKLMATPDEYAAMEADFRKGGIGYGDFKKRLLDKTWNYFAEAREKRAEIVAKKGYVEDVLQAGCGERQGRWRARPWTGSGQQSAW